MRLARGSYSRSGLKFKGQLPFIKKGYWLAAYTVKCAFRIRDATERCLASRSSVGNNRATIGGFSIRFGQKKGVDLTSEQHSLWWKGIERKGPRR